MYNAIDEADYEDWGLEADEIAYDEWYAAPPRLALPWSLGWPNLTALTAVVGLIAGFLLWGALALVMVSGLQSLSTPVTAAELLAGSEAVDCANLEAESGLTSAERVALDANCDEAAQANDLQ